MSWNPKILNDQANRLGNDLSRSGILDLDSSVDILYKLLMWQNVLSRFF